MTWHHLGLQFILDTRHHKKTRGNLHKLWREKLFSAKRMTSLEATTESWIITVILTMNVEYVECNGVNWRQIPTNTKYKNKNIQTVLTAQKNSTYVHIIINYCMQNWFTSEPTKRSWLSNISSKDRTPFTSVSAPAIRWFTWITRRFTSSGSMKEL